MTAHARSSGFTLIELMVAVGIMLLLTGGGIATFIRFNDRQAVQGAANQLQTIFRSAQVKARAGEKPAACDRLTGYRVQTTANTSQVVLSAVCNNGVFAHSTINLQNSVVAEGSYTMTFANLYGGVTGASTVIIRSSGANLLRYSFTITNSGEVSEGAFL